MSQRTARYRPRRAAPRRTAYRRRSAPPQPKTATVTRKAATPTSGRSRWRMVRLTVSALVLALAVALKLAVPETVSAYRDTILALLGADTDFVEVFSAAGRALSGEGAVGDALNDAYTAVFGSTEVESQPTVARTATLPANVEMLQRVLGFDYAPPADGVVSSLFGSRSDPIEGDGRFHYGVDIAGEAGSVIRAFADGTVTVVGSSSELGQYVTVAHEGGYETLYAHCSRVTASSGQVVSLGDPIAEMGETGRATGVHLHFELHCDGDYLNPLYYVA